MYGGGRSKLCKVERDVLLKEDRTCLEDVWNNKSMPGDLFHETWSYRTTLGMWQQTEIRSVAANTLVMSAHAYMRSWYMCGGPEVAKRR